MRVDLEDAGDSTDAQALSKGAYGPHQKLHRDTLAMQRCAVGFEEVALAGSAMQLPPGTTARMPVGRDIAQAEPTAIPTVGIGTEMPGGVDLAPASSRRDEAGCRGTRGLTVRRNSLGTGVDVV